MVMERNITNMLTDLSEFKRSPFLPWVYGDGIKKGVAGRPVTFIVDMRYTRPGHMTCTCRAPSGQMTYVLVHDNNDGTFTVDLNTCEAGTHVVNIKWDDQDIPGCPFKVRIGSHTSVKKVRVYGRGLNSRPLDGIPGLIHIINDEEEAGKVNVKLSGPEKSKLNIRSWVDETNDKLLNFEFNPNLPGVYTAHVTWVGEDGGEWDVAGSPYEILLATSKKDVKNWKTVLQMSNVTRLEEFQ